VSDPGVLDLVLAELEGLRGSVEEARDAAKESSAATAQLERTFGAVMAECATAKRDAAEALRRVSCCEVRLTERRVERGSRWTFAGAALVALASLTAVIVQRCEAPKVRTHASQAP
jgi:hypothetical protein